MFKGSFAKEPYKRDYILQKRPKSVVYINFVGVYIYFVYTAIPSSVHIHMGWQCTYTYGVATVSRIDKVIGLFCRI